MQSKEKEENNKDKNRKKYIRVERRHITSIRNKTEDITIDFTDIKMIRDYYAHKNGNL